MKIHTNGIDLNFEVTGEGDWITLSHSLACNLEMWDEQVDVLAKDYRVLRFDTRGHGASSAPAGSYTLEQLAEDAHGLLCALGIKQTHWLGLSMGGMIGQTYALKYPETIKSLILADTTSQFHGDAAAMFEKRIQTVEANGMDALVEVYLDRWFTSSYRTLHPEVNVRVARYIHETPIAGFVGCSRAIARIALTAKLRSITCPTLIVVGAEDPATPVAMSQEIRDVISGSELAILLSAKHLSNIEQADHFNAAITNFLRRNPMGSL